MRRISGVSNIESSIKSKSVPSKNIEGKPRITRFERHQNREKRLNNYIKTVEIKVKYIPEPELTKNAIESFNKEKLRKHPSGSIAPISRAATKSTLTKIRYAYIRHTLTNYDEIVATIKRMSPLTKSKQVLLDKSIVRLLRIRVNDAIRKEYGVLHS